MRFGATYLTPNLTLGSEHAQSRADKFKDAESRAAQGRQLRFRHDCISSFLSPSRCLSCFLLVSVRLYMYRISHVEAIKANNKERKLAKKRKVRLVKVNAFSFSIG